MHFHSPSYSWGDPCYRYTGHPFIVALTDCFGLPCGLLLRKKCLRPGSNPQPRTPQSKALTTRPSRLWSISGVWVVIFFNFNVKLSDFMWHRFMGRLLISISQSENRVTYILFAVKILKLCLKNKLHTLNNK